MNTARALYGFFNDLTSQIEHCKKGADCALTDVIRQAYTLNPWFTPENQLLMLQSIGFMLQPDKFSRWLEDYGLRQVRSSARRIGIIMAGNIPAVGFHDLLCVLVAGHRAVVKTASDDSVLIRWLGERLAAHLKADDRLDWVDRISDVDAVIATGSNNTARYFEYYFSAIPHLIRKNRNSVAILSGHESDEQISGLCHDILDYFGLGCRNVSKIYVPAGYSFDRIFHHMQAFSGLMQHNRYMNNYDYYRAVYLLNKQPFLTNNFVILKEDNLIASPVSVVFFSFYENEKALRESLRLQAGEIQCIVSGAKEDVPFGRTQFPELRDYADGTDTLQFCLSVN